MSAARPDPTAACPCGSGARFGECCAPILSGAAAANPERLMRSRYTAFAVGDEAHLLASWHPGTRPERVEPDPTVRWEGLEIIDTEAGEPGDRRGWVEFVAHYRQRRERGRLHERSRFVFQSERWWYLDGDVR